MSVACIQKPGKFLLSAKFKARLAADGRTVQRDASLFGPPMELMNKRCIDFISRCTNIRNRKRRKVFLSDLRNGYLHAHLSDENPIYMELPEEFRPHGFTSPCVRVVKALYGLPTAGFDFFNYTRKALLKENWKEIENFPSVYSKMVNNELLILGVYVDDFYLMAPEKEGIAEMENLKKHFLIARRSMAVLVF